MHRTILVICLMTSMEVEAGDVPMIKVTAPGGSPVHINPSYITKMYPTKEAMEKGPNQMVVSGARCVITMADTKFISVTEPCDYVLQLIEGKSSKRR